MKKYTSILAILLLVVNYGCKKDYLSLEANPNSPSVTTPGLTLAAALADAASIVQVQYVEYNVWAGFWTYSGNYVPNGPIDQFVFNGQTFDGPTAQFTPPGTWISLFGNLSNLNTLQNISSASPADANFEAIAQIMKAYDFQLLVDQFNDIPYSQAFQPSTHLFPAYDKAADIYHDLGKQLDAAIALINKNPTATSPGSSDIMFGGNMASWKKFANSIKLRLAIHVSTNTPGDPLVTDLASTAAEGYLDETVSATVNPGYANSLASSGASQQNPFWDIYGLNTSSNPAIFNPVFRANAFSVDFMTSTNDARVSQLYAPVTGLGSTVKIQGNIFGNTASTLQPNSLTSGFGPGLLQSSTQDAILFRGSESLFLQAEAALKGYLTGNPQTLYQRGITASFVEVKAGGTYTSAPVGYTPQTPQFTYSPATAAQSAALAVTYYSQNINNVGWTASTNKLQAIITQKWIALNGLFPLEAYGEFWRTGFPALKSSIDPSAISTTLPTRIYYPTTELTSNGANLAKVGTIDPFTSKIFWAKTN